MGTTKKFARQVFICVAFGWPCCPCLLFRNHRPLRDRHFSSTYQGTDSDIMGDSGATFPDYVDQDLFTQLWTVTDDGSFFINMFKDWCSNVATKVPIANQQLADGNYEALTETMHPMGSAAGYLGAKDVLRHARALENEIEEKDAPSVDFLRECMTGFVDASNVFINWFENMRD